MWRLLFALAWLMPLASIAQHTFDKDKSSLKFTASTWLFNVESAFSDWDIVGTKTGDKVTDLKFTVTVKTTSFDTQNSKRDKHLRTEDFFWVEKYPVATFESTKIEQKSETLFHIKGDLTFRGIKKPLEFDARLVKKDGQYRVVGDLEIKRQDFGIVYEGGLFTPSIKDMVKVHFDVRSK